MNEEKMNKLPKWAKREFQKMQQRIDALEEATAQIEASFATSVYWTTGGYMDPKVEIPEYARVVFTLDGGEIEVYLRDGALVLRNSHRSGSGSLLVQPEAGNTLKVKAGPYWSTAGRMPSE